jgi:hypothetical protein
MQTQKSAKLNIAASENVFDNNNLIHENSFFKHECKKKFSFAGLLSGNNDNERVLVITMFEDDNDSENDYKNENVKYVYSFNTHHYSGCFYKNILTQLLSDIFWLGKNKYI